MGGIKTKGGIDSFASEGRDKNVMLAGRNILSGIDGTGRLIDHEGMGEA